MTGPRPPSHGKEVLRERVLAGRRALSPAALTTARDAVAAHLLAGLPAQLHVVGAYRPMRTEPGSEHLLAQLTARGLRVLLPVTLPDRDLAWTDLTGARFGPDEIGAADVVVVPALAVGPAGERLGRGGGSYDRALRRTTARRVALLHRGELLPEVPVDPWDVPVHVAVTPDGWFELANR